MSRSVPADYRCSLLVSRSDVQALTALARVGDEEDVR